MNKYYEVHQKKVWEVYADSESEAVSLARYGVGTLMEDEFFVDKTSEVADE